MTTDDPGAAAAGWTALGCWVHLVVTDRAALDAARSMLAADLADLDAACSRFRADSELVALDRAQGRPVRLSPLLANAVAVALRAAELTDGDVDPTVGEAIVAAGYDRDFSLVPPDGPALHLVVKAVPGWRHVRLDPATRTLAMPAGVRLDLGATAKAWAADRAAARIAAALGVGVLVGLGGDIAVAGQAPPGGWRIRVQDVTGRPEDVPDGPSTVVAITSGALATSGTDRAAVAARRQRPAPHPGSAHRAAPGARLAHDLGHRRHVRGRQRGQHRSHHPRYAGSWLAGGDRAARPAGRRQRPGGNRRGLARRGDGALTRRHTDAAASPGRAPGQAHPHDRPARPTRTQARHQHAGGPPPVRSEEFHNFR